MIHNDYTFYNKEIEYWHTKAEEYANHGDDEGVDRCLLMAGKMMLYRDEAEGKIVVVSGRKGFGKSLNNPNAVGFRPFTAEEKTAFDLRVA